MATLLGRRNLRDKLWEKFKRKRDGKVVGLQLYSDRSSTIARHKNSSRKLNEIANSGSTLMSKSIESAANLRGHLAITETQQRNHSSFNMKNGETKEQENEDSEKTYATTHLTCEKINLLKKGAKNTILQYEITEGVRKNAPFPSFSETVKVLAIAKSRSNQIISVKCGKENDGRVTCKSRQNSVHTSCAAYCSGNEGESDGSNDSLKKKKSGCKILYGQKLKPESRLDQPCQNSKSKSEEIALVVKPICIPKVGKEQKNIEKRTDTKVTNKNTCDIPSPTIWHQRVKKPQLDCPVRSKTPSPYQKKCLLSVTPRKSTSCQPHTKDESPNLNNTKEMSELDKKLQEPPPLPPQTPSGSCLPVCVPCMPKCPEPQKTCATKCGRTFWESVTDFLNFFRAREGCPTPAEAKRQHLIKKARIAADKVDMDLCPRNRVRICCPPDKSKGKKKNKI